MKRYSVNVRTGSTYIIYGAIKFSSESLAKFVCKQLNSSAMPGLDRPLKEGWEAVIEEVIVDRDDAEAELEELQYEFETSFPEEDSVTISE